VIAIIDASALKFVAYLHCRRSAPQARHSPERNDFADEPTAPVPFSTVRSRR